MRFFFLLISLVLGLFLGPAHIAQAQGLGGLLATGESALDTDGGQNIDAILSKAAEKGVGVVIIDSDGNVISQPATDVVGDSAPPNEEVHSPLMIMQDNVVKFRGALIERLLQLPDATNEVLYILRAASPDGTLWAFGKALLLSLALFFVGSLVELHIYGVRFMTGPVTRRIMDNPQGYIEKMPFLVFRFVTGVIGILISMAVAYVLGFVIFGPLTDTAMQFTVTLINIGYFACRFVAGLWRMILSPFLEQYRIPALTNREAKRLHRWLWVLATFDICAILFGIWIGELGLNYEVYAFLASMLSAVIVLMNILLVLVNRRAITRALRNDKPLEECSVIVRMLCKVWAPMVVFYVLFAWVELTYDLVLGNPSSIPLIAGAYGILISIIVVYGVINYVIERSFARARQMRRLNALSAEEEAQAAALAAAEAAHSAEADALADALAETQHEVAEQEQRAAVMGARKGMNTFEQLARRVAGILAFVAGAYAFFYIWDNDSAQMV